MGLQITAAFLGLAVLVLAIISVRLALRAGKQAPPAGENEALMMLQRQVESLRAALDQGQRESMRVVNEQLAHVTVQLSSRLEENARAIQNSGKSLGEGMDSAAKAVGNVQQSLARLDEANKRIYDLGQSISGLEKLLRAPKLRGGLGEFFLEELLAQILPSGSFDMQYSFQSKKKVDAVIRIGDRLVPVDAKFPMESFQRMVAADNEADQKRAFREFTSAVKKQVEEIASSYILPDEKTFNFALMYIPAENIYYETIIKDDRFGEDESIAAYALKRHVIPVSPNNLFAYLQTIILGLKGLSIEKRTEEVIEQLDRLKREFDRFAKDFNVLGTHIVNAKNKYEESEKHLGRFIDKLEIVTKMKEMESGESLKKIEASTDENSES